MTSHRDKLKAQDEIILALNSAGLSLTYIADQLKVHPSTVTYRLKALGIPPADTRRTFMEDIFESLTLQQQIWLLERLGPGYSVKEFVRSLIVNELVDRNRPA